MLQEQLHESLDDGIEKLQIGGARGVLFKVTLLAYGYTFISKGTVKAFIKDLEHEAAVYERLRPIQGVRVPVFLGAIDLRPLGKVYYYDHRVYIVHMTFLSWGGYTLSSAEAKTVSTQSLRESAICSVRAIHGQGVQHNDIRAPNMLFNQELHGVMLIDFERAKLLEMPRPALLPAAPNKRARDPGDSGKDFTKRVKKMLEEGILMAEQIFQD